jgi:hypothetical protein
MKKYLPDEIWEKSLRDGSLNAVESYLEGNPSNYVSNNLDYPFVHRICDFTLKGHIFRLLRKVASNTEKLFITECDDQSASESFGVPYPLKGDSLKKWLHDEDDKNYDTDYPTPWGNYIETEILEKYISELKPIVHKKETKTDFIVETDGVIRSTTSGFR